MADYCTVDELKAQIDLEDAAGDDTLMLTAIITAASRAIDNFCNRPKGFVADAAASANYYAGTGEAYQGIDECVEITEVAVKESITEATYTAWNTPTTNFSHDGDWIAYRGSHRQPFFNQFPYNGLMVDPVGDESHFRSGKYVATPGFRPSYSYSMRETPTVKVTAKWGYAVAVPTPIKQACIIQSGRWYKRGASGWSDALASGELGQLMYTQKLDPDVEMILGMGRYTRMAVG